MKKLLMSIHSFETQTPSEGRTMSTYQRNSWSKMMKSPATLTRAIPLHDYGPALESAVSWLGERHLLAEPVPRRNNEPKPFFNAARSWYPHSARV